MEKIRLTPRSVEPAKHSSSPSLAVVPNEPSTPSEVDTTAGFRALDPEQCCDIDLSTGRLRSISAEELKARHADLTRRLAEIDAEDDTPDETYDTFMRNLDEERERQGRPPAFENCY